MAYDIAPAFSDKIDKERVKEMGMGDAAWDRAVVDALGGEMTAEKSEWTVEKIASLPDSSFTYVEPGGTKDASGRTTPLSLRCLPYKDASGQVDHEQLRLAIASVPKANLPASTKARVLAKLEAVPKSLDDKGFDDLKKYITHSGDKWTVHAESGKVLGTHGSEADAQAQLAAVEAHKRPKGKDVHWPVDDPRAPNQPRNEKFLGEVREAVKAKAGPGSRVQTLVFDKEKYPKAEDAQGWASDHGFKSEEVDETGESFRLRQEDPGAFVRMRTISLTEGVGAVVGFPKRSIDAIKDAFFTTASGRLAFKAEDLAAAEFEPVEESASGVVYRVKVGDLVTYLAESGGVAAPLPMYRELQKTSYVPISKSSDEKRYTLGVVYPASKKGTPEPDFHGDVMSEDEIEKSAWGFMSKGNDRVGLMHRPGTTGAGRVVESYVYRGPSYKLKDATGQEQEISPGDWMLGVVWEPEAWKAIKSGTITGYSLQGAARKTLFGSEE